MSPGWYVGFWSIAREDRLHRIAGSRRWQLLQLNGLERKEEGSEEGRKEGREERKEGTEEERESGREKRR